MQRKDQKPGAAAYGMFDGRKPPELSFQSSYSSGSQSDISTGAASNSTLSSSSNSSGLSHLKAPGRPAGNPYQLRVGKQDATAYKIYDGRKEAKPDQLHEIIRSSRARKEEELYEKVDDDNEDLEEDIDRSEETESDGDSLTPNRLQGIEAESTIEATTSSDNHENLHAHEQKYTSSNDEDSGVSKTSSNWNSYKINLSKESRKTELNVPNINASIVPTRARSGSFSSRNDINLKEPEVVAAPGLEIPQHPRRPRSLSDFSNARADELIVEKEIVNANNENSGISSVWSPYRMRKTENAGPNQSISAYRIRLDSDCSVSEAAYQKGVPTIVSPVADSGGMQKSVSSGYQIRVDNEFSAPKPKMLGSAASISTIDQTKAAAKSTSVRGKQQGESESVKSAQKAKRKPTSDEAPTKAEAYRMKTFNVINKIVHPAGKKRRETNPTEENSLPKEEQVQNDEAPDSAMENIMGNVNQRHSLMLLPPEEKAKKRRDQILLSPRSVRKRSQAMPVAEECSSPDVTPDWNERNRFSNRFNEEEMKILARISDKGNVSKIGKSTSIAHLDKKYALPKSTEGVPTIETREQSTEIKAVKKSTKSYIAHPSSPLPQIHVDTFSSTQTMGSAIAAPKLVVDPVSNLLSAPSFNNKHRLSLGFRAYCTADMAAVEEQRRQSLMKSQLYPMRASKSQRKSALAAYRYRFKESEPLDINKIISAQEEESDEEEGDLWDWTKDLMPSREVPTLEVEAQDHEWFDEKDNPSSGDWNRKYREILSALSQFKTGRGDNEENAEKLMMWATKLISLANDFVETATAYGRIIISEAHVPFAEKTIQPVALGGVAGGAKYIVQDVLFKFSFDIDGLYGGKQKICNDGNLTVDDSAAATVAGHELKGLQAYFNCAVPGMNLPLMALVDYKGFRLLALSLLPVTEETIVCGSNDCGLTVHCSDQKAMKIMAKSGEMLNISPHMAGLDENKRANVFTAVDVEAHRGLDGRIYLIDFSRCYPPESPHFMKHTPAGCNLTRLLRPEFVRSYPVPLCSDAFSYFTDPSYNDEIDRATAFLRDEVVPQFATKVVQILAECEGALHQFRIAEHLHASGINVRHLGLVYRCMNQRLQIGVTNEAMHRVLMALILIEMVSRVAKHDIRRLLRRRMRKLRMPLKQPFHLLLSKFINIFIGNTKSSEEFWQLRLREKLDRKFEGLYIPPAKNFKQQFMQLCEIKELGIDTRLLLLKRLQQMMGFRLTNKAQDEFNSNSGGRQYLVEPIDQFEIEDIGERVKYINIISHAEGFVLMHLGSQSKDKANAIQYLSRAMHCFEEVLKSNSNAKITLRLAARSLLLLDELLDRQKSRRVHRAAEYLKRALSLDPDDPETLYLYGKLKLWQSKNSAAEEIFLRALEIDPDFVPALTEYAAMLKKSGNHIAADQFLARAVQARETSSPAFARSSSEPVIKR